MDMIWDTCWHALRNPVAAFSQLLSYQISGCKALNYVGAVTVATSTVIAFYEFLWKPFRLYALAKVLPVVNLKRFGRWAVITGGTDGIGRGYADALAQIGLDIILISRSEEKLSRVANELKANHKVEVKVIAADFSKTDVYNKIEQGLDGLDISILVNNVGIGHAHATFLKVENMPKSYMEMVNVNCVAMTAMSALVLPQMVEKKGGVIVNISSIACLGYVTSAVYSATKAYVSVLSDCLSRTYSSSGVIVQTLEAGMVRTRLLESSFQRTADNGSLMLKLSKYMTTVSVQSYVHSALRTIGVASNCNGNFFHYCISWLIYLHPVALRDRLLLDIADK